METRMYDFFNAIINSSIKYVCELTLVISLFFTFFQQIHENKYKNILRGDGVGYYSYLPAVFIYHDYTYSFINSLDQKYNTIKDSKGFIKHTPSGDVNKYYVGLSILWLPFFFIAYMLSFLFGYAPDGYSFFFQLSIIIASNFYLWLGCRYTRKLILSYHISEGVAAFIIILIVFATNLLHYVTFDSFASHAYSFTLISIFLFIGHSFFQNKKTNNIYWMAFLLALIFLVRPTNILIVILLLFFAKNIQSFFDIIKSYRYKILKGIGIFLLTLTPQFVLYYLQTGNILVWSYGDENFNFNNPEIINILFSYRKGLFVYTPIVFLSLFGLLYVFKKNKFQFIILSFFLFITTYVISSWWCWDYGSSLGQRSFVDYYAVIGLLLTFLYLNLHQKFIRLFFFITPIFIIYSLTLSYQYQHYILDWNSMTKQKFWTVFMKTDEMYEGIACSNTFFSGSEYPHLISLKTSHGNFVIAPSEGRELIYTNSKKGGVWETFNMLFLSENKIALKADNGKYVSARLDDGNVLKHNASEMKEWEIFEMIRLKNGKVILKACNNKFATINNENIFMISDNMGEAECFELIEK